MDNIILEIMEKVFEIKDLDINCEQQNCRNWDSLRHLNLIVTLEEEFGLEFEPEEISQMKSFSQIKQMIASKTHNEV